MRIQTFTKIACFATFLSCNFQLSKANPIINEAEGHRSRPGYLINQPINGGTTTLKEAEDLKDEGIELTTIPWINTKEN